MIPHQRVYWTPTGRFERMLRRRGLLPLQRKLLDCHRPAHFHLQVGKGNFGSPRNYWIIHRGCQLLINHRNIVLGPEHPGLNIFRRIPVDLHGRAIQPGLVTASGQARDLVMLMLDVHKVRRQIFGAPVSRRGRNRQGVGNLIFFRTFRLRTPRSSRMHPGLGALPSE